MKKIFLFACFFDLLFFSPNLYAGDGGDNSGDLFSKFDGDVTARVFADFEQGLFENNELSGFNLNRACLGYKAKFGAGLSAIIDVDFGATTTVDGEKVYATYVRNAELQWNRDKFQLNFGMIAPKLFNYQENFWGYRYSVKSSMDEYKFGSSRDLGVSAQYSFNDNIAVDANILNGEGYKSVFSADNQYKFGVGTTVKPIENFIFRGYGELYNYSGDSDMNNQYLMALMLGYEDSRLAVGVEYNRLWNTKFVEGRSQSIVSTYVRYKIDKKQSIYGRYDNFHSKNDWNGEQNAIYLGYQIQPVKYVKISPMVSYKFDKEEKMPTVGLYLDLKL